MVDNFRPRILCVDDEKNVLEGLGRTLRSLYVVETAVGGAAGLEVLSSKGPFAVVVSDLRMPGMNGIEFLSFARHAAPDTVRALLTGQADMDAAIRAVNDGNIFRFLSKPCPTDMLVKALAACAEQYRLVTSERVLLEQTLRGSVKALTDILALANPAAFGRAMRVQQSVLEMMAHFKIGKQWPVEVAAMLSQIGCVTLPQKTQDKLYQGEPLNDEEQAMVDRMPQVVENLLANIPRLEPVREILRLHVKKFSAFGKLGNNPSNDVASWGGRALKIALDFDMVESERIKPEHPVDVLRGRTGSYDPAILEAFAEVHGNREQQVNIRELPLRGLTVGLVFGEDVRTSKGLLLIARGQEVTPSLLERVRNFSPELGIREPIRMIVKKEASPATIQPSSPVG